ncbi:MAG TPA: FAD:protein FMN transferase [Vicinamibacterales bacterium]
MTPPGVKTVPLMGTLVTIQVVGHDATAGERDARDAAIERAFDWFRQVEACCSRFDPTSELRRLGANVGIATTVSEMLFRAVEFACALAAETDGAFDPTVGGRMTALGFDRHDRTGERTGLAVERGDHVSYRDLEIDLDRRTITVARPLQLDLGAVAKGLAIDLAAHELAPWVHYAIDAGGDLYLAGRNAQQELWTVGIRHPREPGSLVGTIRATDRAVCTSGDYERLTADGASHHLVDPTTGASATETASVTVVAPTAMVADGLGTAAFVLGPSSGLALLERAGVDGLIVSADLAQVATAGMRDALFSHA